MDILRANGGVQFEYCILFYVYVDKQAALKARPKREYEPSQKLP
jgi:hypothetical protein